MFTFNFLAPRGNQLCHCIALIGVTLLSCVTLSRTATAQPIFQAPEVESITVTNAIGGAGAPDGPVSEGRGIVRLRVKLRNIPSLDTPKNLLTLPITYGGTAGAGDYVQKGTFEAPVGEGDKSFALEINDDSEVEDPETILVTIGGVTATITIYDNEPYKVTFTAEPASVTEGRDFDTLELVDPKGETFIKATLDRPLVLAPPSLSSSGPLQFNVSAEFVASDSTATDDDFQLGSQTDFSFKPGKTEAENKISLSAFTDSEAEPTEVVVLRPVSTEGNAPSSTDARVASSSPPLEIKITDAPPPSGNLTLIKQVDPGPNARAGTFIFDVRGVTSPPIVIDTVETQLNGETAYIGRQRDPLTAVGGTTITITQQANPGFTPTLALCIPEGGRSTTHTLTATDRSFDITVRPNEDTVCTIYSTAGPLPVVPPEPPTPPVEPARPTLTVETISIGGTSTFRFTGTGTTPFNDLALSTLRNNEVVASDSIPATTGPTSITQAQTRGFTFVSANCRLGETALGTANPETRSIALDIPETGDIVCTFVNRGQSARTATIIKNFLNRRAEALTNDTGRSRLIERRKDGERRRYDAGRFAAGSLKDSLGVIGEGNEREGKFTARTSLRKLGGALGDGSASAKAARLGLNASDYGVQDEAAYRSGWDIWTEANWNYRRSDGGDADGIKSSGQFGLLRAGVDYLVSRNILVGAVLQYDYLSDESNNRDRGDGYEISGHGWMAGPYVEIALSNNLVFDAKGLWGTSRNKVSPDLTFSDTFSTDRWLASARLTGSWSWAQSTNSTWHFSPTAEFVWFNEKSESFTNALGVDIDRQSVNLGRFKVGPEISYRYTAANGMLIEPRIGAQALWRFTGAGQARATDLDTAGTDGIAGIPTEKFQMRFVGGLKVEMPHGTRVELEGSYTGLGRQGQETIGGKVGVTIPLQ